MPDTEDLTSGARYQPGVAPQHVPFPLRGCGSLDWGMQSRLTSVFRPGTWRMVTLAIDHGYFLGPITGLERVDPSIVPLPAGADALMTTRGMIRSTVPPSSRIPVVLRDESIKPEDAYEQYVRPAAQQSSMSTEVA